MAWIIVLNGACISLDSTQAQEHQEAISNSDAFKQISLKCQALDLVLTTGEDDEKGVLNIFIGKDLHPDRHFTVGQAETCAAGDLPAEFDDLCNEVLALAMSINQASSIKTGTVIYHFD